MAITKLVSPANWARCGDTNRMYYKFSSDNYSSPNFMFQFVLYVYSIDGTETNIGTYNMHATPNGDVEFNPSAIYANYLGYDFDISKWYLTEMSSTILKFRMYCYEYYGTPPIRQASYDYEFTPLNVYNGSQQNIPYDYTPLNTQGNLKWVMNNYPAGTTGQFLTDATEYRLDDDDFLYLYALGPIATGRPDRIRYNVYYAPLSGHTDYTSINATYNSGSTFSSLTTGVSYSIESGTISINDGYSTKNRYEKGDSFTYGIDFPIIPTDLNSAITYTITLDGSYYEETPILLVTGKTYTVVSGDYAIGTTQDIFFDVNRFEYRVLPQGGLYGLDQGLDYWGAYGPLSGGTYYEMASEVSSPRLPIPDGVTQWDPVDSITGDAGVYPVAQYQDGRTGSYYPNDILEPSGVTYLTGDTFVWTGVPTETYFRFNSCVLSYVVDNRTVYFNNVDLTSFNSALSVQPYTITEENPNKQSYEQSVANSSTINKANSKSTITSTGLKMLSFYDTMPTFNYTNSLGYYIPCGPFNTMKQRHGTLQQTYVNERVYSGTTILTGWGNLISGTTYKVVGGGQPGVSDPIAVYENDGTWTGLVYNIGDSFTWDYVPTGFYWQFNNCTLEYTTTVPNVIFNFLDFKIENWVYYEMDLIYNFTPLSTYPLRVIKKERCDNKYDAWQLFWMNPHGGFDTYIFNKKVDIDYKNIRSTYKQKIPPTFSPYTAGEKVFNINITEEITLRSDLLTQKESQLLVQLTQSPVVYALKHYEYEGNKTYFVVPYIITSENILYEQKKNSKEIFVEIKMRASNARIIQKN